VIIAELDFGHSEERLVTRRRRSGVTSAAEPDPMERPGLPRLRGAAGNNDRPAWAKFARGVRPWTENGGLSRNSGSGLTGGWGSAGPVESSTAKLDRCRWPPVGFERARLLRALE